LTIKDICYSLVSRGKLPNVLAPTVILGAGSILTFSWMDNSGAGLAKATNQAILVAYCPELKQAIYTLPGGLRSELTGELHVLPFSGLAVQTWVGFISETKNGSIAGIEFINLMEEQECEL
jgi:hypothetical protein